jgi:hypothetical protein
MALFDTATFFKLMGEGEGPTRALGTAFGMPTCLLNLTQDLISLLPGNILDATRNSTNEGITAADDAITTALANLGFLDGIIEYDTETGTFRFVSQSSKNGLDGNENDKLNSIGGFIGAAIAGAAAAGRLYNNYIALEEQLTQIADCFQSYADYLGYTGPAKANKRALLDPLDYEDLFKQYDIVRSDLEDAFNFRDRALNLLNLIDDELADRAENPGKEPVFLPEYAVFVSGTGALIEASAPAPVEQIFRLQFGPPKSTSGRFILSIDGLYYDSQTSGLTPALLEVEKNKSNIQNNLIWKLDFEPNVGGRGKQITLDGLKSYVDTILDPNIVNQSNFIREYYDRDEVLVNLIGQKNRRVFDLSSQVVELQSVSAAQVLISNMRQVIISEASHYQQKINKRRKQIELAVLMPSIYRNEILYSPGDKIPVNDFSYLQGINYSLDIEKQKSLVLSQNEVSGVVLPLEVKYVQQIDQPERTILDHLLINNIGIGSIVADGSGTMPPELTITDRVSTDRLIALYNLLKFEVVDPSSTSFKLNNSSDLSMRLDAQIVGPTNNKIFTNGVGIAKLDGITKHSSTQPTVPSSLGSFIKLPQQKELQDFLYNREGATFEAWIHTPYLTNATSGFDSNGVSGLYRLILANENTGLKSNGIAQSDILRIRNQNSSDIHKGIIFGFTRDRRFTLNESASNNTSDNPAAATCLVLAPTQSFNASSTGFINRTYDLEAGCTNLDDSWYGMTFPVSSAVNGVYLSSCNNQFSQITVTLDPTQDQIRFYCDGQLLTTSSYFNVFGVKPDIPVNVPSLKLNNSFEYNSNYMSSVNVPDLKAGPKLDQYFTPWIIGGGYTDGMQTGNFMGGQYGGIISGLKGFIGGIKFYSKPLNSEEVLGNFNALRNFFKNIDTTSLN